MRPITRITTADADIHDIEGEIDLVRMKVERNQWLVSTDGRYVRCDKVVSLWVPGPDEPESIEQEGL